jgi:putative membrane-bound dehydrogenase-like protein
MHRMHHRMSMTPILRKSLAAVLCLVLLPAAQGETGPPPQGRAFHFAGGRMKSQVKLGENYSVALWLWNALPADARAVTGYAFSRGADGDKDHGEHFGIGGTYKAEAQGRLILFNGNEKDQLLIGKTKLAGKAWHHVVLVREGAKVRVHLDGKPVPDLEGELPVVIKSADVFIGGRADNFSNWEGKLDEVAIFDRALTPQEANALYQAAKMTPPATSGSGFQPAGEDKDSGLEARATGVEFPPLSPEEGLKSIHVPDGFKVELVACEPNVIDPIAIDWDLAGRLWVVEMADYPSGMDGNGKPGGRVRVLEDTDGDGRYEKSTLFADGLNFPTGLLTWRDGVIVTAAPDVLFLKDTNGDGKADSTEKLLSGLSEGNQQLRANGLRWGLDGRIYCAAGGHHGGHAADTVLQYRDPETGGMREEKIGSRDFSFFMYLGHRPGIDFLRAESGPSQFGRNRDDAGHWFGTQNSRALWHYVLPDHYLKRNPHVPAPDPTHLIVTPLNAPVYPVSPPEKRFHSFENAGHYTSACSGMIYRDELLFPLRENELDAFTCEPFHNLVQHNILVEDGVTWKAKRAPGEEKHDFFASTDRWCRPVMTRTGPDGALWVVDMYRYMIEHPAWLPENGRAELLPHYRLGDDKGRIYRVFHKDRPPRKVMPLDKFTPVELVKAMDSPNEWQRDKAHMALSEMRWPDDSQERAQVISAANGLLNSNNPFARIHAMWLIREETWYPPDDKVLSDPDPRVRINAIQAEEGTPQPGFLKLQADPSPKVRLQLALTAGMWPFMDKDRSEEWALGLGRALAAIAIRDHADPWMRAAVMSSAIPHLRALCEGIAAAGGDAFAAYADGLIVTALGLNDRDSLAAMLRPLLTGEDKQLAVRFRALARFLTALHGRGKSRPALMDKADALTEALRGISRMQDRAQDSLRNPEVVADLRSASAEFLSVEESTRPTVKEIVPNWLSPGSDAALQLAAVKVLASTGEATVPAILLHDFPSLTPQTRGAVIEALLTREPWALALLEHVKANPATALDATQRARLAQHSSKKVSELAGAVLKAESSRKEVLEQFRPALSLKGDAARGKTVALRCIGCHQVDGAGLAIGPDLKSVASHPAEKLLTNIIDPSLDVQPGFFAFNAKLKDGSELYGLITSETGNSVSFKLTDGSTKLVLRSDLADLKSTGQSLMPPGLETGMTAQEMADLIAWLQAAR